MDIVSSFAKVLACVRLGCSTLDEALSLLCSDVYWGVVEYAVVQSTSPSLAKLFARGKETDDPVMMAALIASALFRDSYIADSVLRGLLATAEVASPLSSGARFDPGSGVTFEPGPTSFSLYESDEFEPESLAPVHAYGSMRVLKHLRRMECEYALRAYAVAVASERELSRQFLCCLDDTQPLTAEHVRYWRDQSAQSK